MTNWRLSSGVTAIEIMPYEEHEIYLCSSEKKSFKSELEKLISTQSYYYEGMTRTFDIDSNEFNIKISENPDGESLSLYVKSAEFPEDCWYKVKNFHKNHFGKLLLFNRRKEDGIELEGTFEAIFSSNDTEKNEVSFCNSIMPNYSECLEEFRRRLNCELLTKTKKFVNGGRYDSPEETRYYLCKVFSRREKPGKSECLTDKLVMPEVYLYVNKLNPTDKSVSDVLTTRAFGNNPEDIHVSRSFTPMVDSGERPLVDDFSGNIEDYWIDMIHNTTNSNDVLSCSNVFDILSLASRGGVDELTKDAIKSYLTKVVDEINFRYFDVESVGSERYRLGSDRSQDDNILAGKNLIIYNTSDPNISRESYYHTLFNTVLGIKVDDIILKSQQSWNPKSLLSDFSTYYKNIEYFIIRDSDKYKKVNQRVNSLNYKIETTTLQSKFGNNELTKTIIALIEFARKNGGLGVNRFTIYNVGTKKSPKEYISIRITLNDIVKYLGGVDKMSNSIKDNIMNCKFCELNIEIDKEGKVE